MRYGIFSDIHGNLEALEKAISFYRKAGIDKFIFLGDVVGYGPDPNQTIAILRELNPVCVAGNHDWAVINKLNWEYFNPYAREAILWTINELTEEAKQFLYTFPLIYEESDFICVHGSLVEPFNFHYIMSRLDAYLNFKVLNKKVCFIGHSHRQEVFYFQGGRVIYSRDKKIYLSDDAQYIINVGSIGQPRDKDCRLSVSIYDEEKKVVMFERLEYNIKKVADKILRNNLPPILAARLYAGW